MNIAIIGLGNFGSNLARSLFDLGHQLTVLDLKDTLVARHQDFSDQAVTADATDRAVLDELGLQLMDAAVVCIGDPMGASILATLHLRDMGVKNLVAKAVSPEHERVLKRVGASKVIFPEREAAQSLAVSMSDPNLLEYLPLGNEFSVMELAPTSEQIGKTLKELDLRRKYGVNVIAIRELVPKRTHLILEPDYLIKDSDVLVVLGRRDNLEKLTGK